MRAAPTSGTASVLFTDLMGSTELLARLGDLPYDEVRRDHFAVLPKPSWRPMATR
jgi:class 3 adenylate cyclase